MESDNINYMKYVQMFKDFCKKDPKLILLIFFGVLFLVQIERLMYTIDDNGYYAPSSLRVEISEMPTVDIGRMPTVEITR